MKYGSINPDQVEAAIDKLGGMDGWRALLDDKLDIRPKIFPPFPKNEHGHYIIEVIGLNLTGAEEIMHLQDAGFRVYDSAKCMLTSTNPDSYDTKHRLEEGKVYRVAIVPSREVKKNRTRVNLQAFGSQFGYLQPLAGIQPRIREVVSDTWLEVMGICYIASLHEVIKDSEGVPRVLCSHRDHGGHWLSAYKGHPDGGWDGEGAIAFLVP